MKQFDQVAWLSLGSEKNGAYLGIVRSSMANQPTVRYGGSLTAVVVNPRTNWLTTNYILTDQGYRQNPNQPSQQYPYKYDARSRPWYRAAADTGKPVWSDIFQTPPASESDTIFISASHPVYDRNQNLKGVVAVDYILTDLQQYLSKEVRLSQRGETFIMDRSGNLVASSAGDRPFRMENDRRTDQRLSITEMSNPLLKETANHLKAKFQDFSTLTEIQKSEFVDEQGLRQLVQISPYQDSWGLNWLVITVVPEADFLAAIQRNSYHTIAICLGALGVAFIISWREHPTFEKIVRQPGDH